MKWRCVVFLFFLIPALACGFDKSQANELREQASSEWSRHNELIEGYKGFGADPQGHGLHHIKEALSCCHRALSLTENLLKEIRKLSKKQRKNEWWAGLKNICKKDCETISREIDLLERGLDNIISAMARKKVQDLYEESLSTVNQAVDQYKECPSHNLLHSDILVSHLKEIALLYRQAESLARQAHNTLVTAPSCDEVDAADLEQVIENYKRLAESVEREAAEWPEKAVKQKITLIDRLEALTESFKVFEEKKLMRSCHEMQKQALPILETLIQNSEGEEKEHFESELDKLKNSISEFEKSVDQNRFVETKPAISFQSFKSQEESRRRSFFRNDLKIDPSLLFQTLIAPTSRPCALPLDRQMGGNQNEYLLYLDQFYRFYLQSDTPISKLVVKVHKLGCLVFEEEIALPIANTPTWRSYLLEGGSIFIPETKLQREYGLDLRLRFVNDPKSASALIISQKASNPDYTFSFSVDDSSVLYNCDFRSLPPWQLNALRKPPTQAPSQFVYKNNYTFSDNSVSIESLKLDKHFPLLDEFVETHKKDPLALAAYVQNEISLVHPSPYIEEGVFQAPMIKRNALRVYLEGCGSAWEQCQLLVYLLRKSGYRAVYAFGQPCSLPKQFVENMLFTSLPEGEEEGILNYPWVVFFDGENWIPLFPWIKEIQVNEGFNVYDCLPEEFASAERWILHYLKGDERILKNIKSKDESAGRLFAAFVEEHLRKEGLSLDDVGTHRTQIKRQFSSFKDFPSPKVREGGFSIFNLDENSSDFAKVYIEIFSRENPEKKMSAVIPLASCMGEGMPLSFKGDRVTAHFIGEEEERHLELGATDRSIEIKAIPMTLIESGISDERGSISLKRGSTSVLCFHFGGATSKLTKLNYDRFSLETEEAKKTQKLLAFLGAAYFEKCGASTALLAKLHKVNPDISFAFGLAKLIERDTNHSKEMLPQVDMCFMSENVPYVYSKSDAFSQYKILGIVDSSSNEHQILRDIFSDLSAVSTVKLLQLAHQYQQIQGDSEEGFLTFDSGLFKEVEENPDISKSLYFSHIKDLNLFDLRWSAQWSAVKHYFGRDTLYSPFFYGYMTPGFIYSPDQIYREMGALIFDSNQRLALISSGSLILNGGLGSPIPSYCFDPSIVPQWQITSNYSDYGNNYKLEIPSKFDPSNPYPPTTTQEKTTWESDVRIEHKSIWDHVADPVNIVTGSFYVDEIDLVLPGPFSLEIRRNYNSQNPVMGEIGAGWKLSLNPFLVSQDDKLFAAESDGTVICYSYNSEKSRWEVFPEDNPDLCNLNQKKIGAGSSPFGAYIKDDVLYGVDGSKRFFKDGLLQKWVNATGAILTFIYRDSRLIRVESSYGEFLRFEYNSAGRIAEIYARDGRRVSYNYSSQGDLVEVTLPNSAITTYEYDHEHRIVKETKPHGAALENIYQEGKIKKQLSPMGPQQQMIVSATFDYCDGVTSVTDAKGGTTTYKIFQRQIYKIIDPLGVEILQSWFIDEETWFDPQTEKILPWDQPGGSVRALKSTTDKRGLTTSYLYDSRGNPTTITLQGEDLTGDGQTSIVKKLNFNDHNLCTQEEISQQKTITIYDEIFPCLPKRIEKYNSNHLISQVDFNYSSQGLLEMANNNGSITRWEYDARGFPTQKIQETGTNDLDVITEYIYNAQGQCIKITTDDAIRENVYDIMGNLVEAHVFSDTSETLSSIYIGYNLNSQPIWEKTANDQNIIYLDYHASGQVKAKRQQLSPSGKFAYTLYEYDPCGYLVEEVDPLGYTTYREYNALGSVLSETKEGHTTHFTYEPGGLIETITSPSGANTTKLYTTNGLLKEEIYPDGTKASIIYDIFSRPIQETKNGITWKIQYDDVHSRITRTHVDTGETEVRKYDARGNLIDFTDAAGFTWQKTYDGLSRIKTKLTPNKEETKWDYAMNIVACYLPSGETVYTTYEGGEIRREETRDAKGNRTRSTYSCYDPKINRKAVVRGGSEPILTWMNTLGKPVKIQKGCGGIIETFEYDARGSCIATTNGEGQTTHQSFDGLGRLIEKKLPDGALLTFDYDLDSNLAQVHFPNGNTWQASYDCMGRKISEQLLCGTEKTGSWEYAYVEGLLKQSKDPAGRMRQYAYDSHGRLIQECVDGWQKKYTYDPRGLVLSAEQIGSQSISWVYSWFATPREEHSIVERSYDADGHLTYESIHLNSELIQETEQEWEPGKRHLRVGDHERTFVYQNNQLAEVVSGTAHLTYTYNRSGRLQSKTTPLTRTVIDYNFCGLPDAVVMHLPGDTIQEALKWGLSGKLAGYFSPLFQEEYTYTSRGHLQLAGADEYEFDFGEPGAGVRTSAPNCQVPQHGLDAFGRVTEEIIEKFSLTKKYDSMGQVVTQGQKQLEWDPWGRLLKITDPLFTWEASYDAFGRRLETRHTPVGSEPVTITSFYDPEEEFQEIGSAFGGKTFWKLHGPDSCDAVIDETGAIVYLMHNALKELTALVSDEGLQYTERICSPYGPQTDASTPSDLLSYAAALSWHSSYLDPTGLILMGKRYYDPKSGKFISPDPVGHPICMDLYAYTNGDPVNYFDPDGRFSSSVYEASKPTLIDGIGYISGYKQTAWLSNQVCNYCYNNNITNSGPFQVGQSDLPNGAIGFVNGICNTREESMAKAERLSQYANGSKVYGVYNASNGIVGDIIDSGLGRSKIMTPPTQQIKDEWNRFFATSEPGTKFFQTCHSHGATHVKNALLTSPEEIRQRIIVLAIAPAEIISNSICYESYNYMSRRDFVTHLDIAGKMKYSDELIILDPHPDAKFFDHDFLSPTFSRHIKNHIKDYIKVYGGE